MSNVVCVLGKAERANHKYIKKVGNKYFYTQDEIDSFKLTKRSDGYYYMDDTKITNDPEKAKAFEEKVKEHKDVGSSPLKVGMKVQIKPSHTRSLGRGIVGTIKEIGKDFVRIVNEAGNVFRVPPSALAYAKALGYDDVQVFLEDAVVEYLEKARKRKGKRFLKSFSSLGHPHLPLCIRVQVGGLHKELEKALPGEPPEDEPLKRGAHRSPPKGYPKKRSQYAIPSEYKYPLDTEVHVRAALSYFSKPKNANKYSPSQQKSIWARIRRAAKKYEIEVSKESGPPSVEK